MGILDAWKARLAGDYGRAGDLYRSQGKFKEAMEVYAQGKLFDQAARTAVALGDLNRAIEFHVQDGNFEAAAALFEKQGKTAQAVDCYVRAKHADKAARLLESSGQWEKAASTWVQAGRKDMAASAYIRAGKPDMAAPVLEGLLADIRRNPLLASDAAEQTRKYAAFLGKHFAERKVFAKSASYYELGGMPVEAARSHAQDGNTRRAVELFIAEREWREAAEIIRSLPAVLPADAEAYGDALGNAGEWERAAQVFEKAGFQFRAAECYEEIGQFERAAQLYAAKDDHVRAAELMEQIENYPEAARHYLQAKNFQRAARCLEQAGLAEKAAELYMQAQRPIEAARIYLARQDHAKAITALQQIESGHPQHRDAAYKLAQLFTRVGRYELAIQKFREGIGTEKLSAASAEKYYQLAICLEEMKAFDKAKEIYTRILAVQFGYRDVDARLQAMAQKQSAARSLEETAQMARQRTGGKISGRYEITDSLDATHYKAWDSSLGRVVSVRRHSLAEVSRLWPMPQERLRAIASLSHPNLVSLYDTSIQGDDLYLFHEYVGGMSLAQILAARGSLPMAEAVRIGVQLARAMEHAHGRGVAHGQLMPANVWISGDNAALVGEFALTVAPAEWRAPENKGTLPPSPQEDVWQFGRLLALLLTGQPPAAGAAPQGVPQALAEACRKALSPKPAERGAALQDFLTAFADMGLLPGAVVMERYEIVAELGAGGMGKVFHARDRELGEDVALKFIHRNMMRDPEARGRFLREIKIMRKLTHPNIVRVHDFGRWEDNEFITMEFLSAEGLDDHVRRHGPMPLARAVSVAARVCEGLEQAHHHGIVHRDIKPQNILLTSDGVPKLLDFGIAHVGSGGTDLTGADQIVGSPKYMSPEQILGKPVDGRTDLYAIGAVLYFLLTGREAFDGDNLQQVIKKQLENMPEPLGRMLLNCPPALEAALNAALQKLSAKRPASAAAFRSMLLEAVPEAASA